MYLEKDFSPLCMAEKADTMLSLADQTESGRPLARVTVLHSCRAVARILKYTGSSPRHGDPACGCGLLCGSDGLHGEAPVSA